MFEHGYALLIGVDQNKVANLALPIVKNDVTKLYEVITHPERCGYPEENVLLLTGTDATRAKILDGFDWLRDKLKTDTDPNQTAFIFYSGHGHRDNSGKAFLIPYDFRFPVSSWGLAAEGFAESIASLQPRRLLVVLDCCHAESMQVKDTQESRLTATAVTADTLGPEMLAEGEGRAVLSSSLSSQLSWIRSDGQMSVFTYHLVEALTGHAGRPDLPTVTVTEVMDYVGRMVSVTARNQHHAEQEPMFRYTGTAFPIALVLGGKGIAKNVAAPDPLAALPLIVRSSLTVDEIIGKGTKVRNVEIDEMAGGQVDATTNVKKVSEGTELISVKIGMQAGNSMQPKFEETIPSAKRDSKPQAYLETMSPFPTVNNDLNVGTVIDSQVIGTQYNIIYQWVGPATRLGSRRSQEAGQSLVLLSEFMRTTEIREAVVVFQNDFKAASQQIAIMSAYKELHDKLHELQSCHNLIVVEAERFPADEAARTNLEDHEVTLQQEVLVIQQMVERSGFTHIEITQLRWQIQQIWQKLHSALDQDDQPGLKNAALQLDRVLGQNLARINTRLTEAAKGLPLLSLVRVMTLIRDKLSNLALDPEKVRQFVAGVESLASLNQQLSALLNEHDSWQLADIELRPVRLDSSQICADLEFCWPQLKQITKPLYSASAEPWAVNFKADCARLESALAEVAPQKVLGCFWRYRRAAGKRFLEVDKNLKKLFENLQKVGDPLVSVLRIIE